MSSVPVKSTAAAETAVPKAKAKGKLSKDERECAAILKGLHALCEEMGGVEALREQQEKRIADFKAKQEKAKMEQKKQEKAPKAKGKKAPEPVDPLTAAIREYERASYFLATVGDFDFTMDDEVQERFHTFNIHQAEIITKRTKARIRNYGKPIPAGDHIDGLAIRTDERMKRRNNNKKGKE